MTSVEERIEGDVGISTAHNQPASVTLHSESASAGSAGFFDSGSDVPRHEPS